MKHEKSTTITGLLMAERDRLKAIADNHRSRAKELIEKAGAEAHVLKVEANRLEKKILEIQECITLEMTTDYVEQKKVDQDYGDEALKNAFAAIKGHIHNHEFQKLPLANMCQCACHLFPDQRPTSYIGCSCNCKERTGA